MALATVQVALATGWIPPPAAPRVIPRLTETVIVALGRRYPPSSVMASARGDDGSAPRAWSVPLLVCMAMPSSPLLTIHLAYRGGAVVLEELSCKLNIVVPVDWPMPPVPERVLEVMVIGTRAPSAPPVIRVV